MPQPQQGQCSCSLTATFLEKQQCPFHRGIYFLGHCSMLCNSQLTPGRKADQNWLLTEPRQPIKPIAAVFLKMEPQASILLRHLYLAL